MQCKLYCALIEELHDTSIALSCNLIQCSSSLVGYFPYCQPNSTLGIYSLHELPILVMNSCFWYTLSLVTQQKPRAIPPSETVFHLSVPNLMPAIFPGDVCSSLPSCESDITIVPGTLVIGAYIHQISISLGMCGMQDSLGSL